MANFLQQLGDFMQLDKWPVVSNFYDGPAERKQKADAEAAIQMLGQYRPEMAQARMNAANQRASLYQPSLDLLARANGGTPGVNVNDIGKQPMSDRMQWMGTKRSTPLPAQSEDIWVLKTAAGPQYVAPGTPGAIPMGVYQRDLPKNQPGFFGSTPYHGPQVADTGWYLMDSSGKEYNVPAGTPGAYTYGENGVATSPNPGGQPQFIGTLKKE